ncbi:N-acetyltransferase family protein [Streptococcus caprae]|uniref:GNAT family N-acetyltransferase n=1 Tax=Streptococcus caprae TaxID=1640501 RepID=A0ABV8CVD4_9STRE
MTIRQATVADIPALESLLQDVLQVHHAVRPDIFKAQGQKFSSQELEEMLADPDKPILVYEKEGQILGHLFCQIQEAKGACLEPMKTLFVDDLCVAESARGQKIGEQLYQYALLFARKNGCKNITLDVWNANGGALNFYQRQGMQAQKTRMEQLIDQED